MISEDELSMFSSKKKSESSKLFAIVIALSQSPIVQLGQDNGDGAGQTIEASRPDFLSYPMSS